MKTFAIHEADGQDVTMQNEVAYSLTSGGGKPGQGYPCVLVVKDEDDIYRQMESDVPRGNDVDAPHIRGNRGR